MIRTAINTLTETPSTVFGQSTTSYITFNNNSTASFTTNAGTSGQVLLKQSSSSKNKGISARLVFKFIKSKLTELEKVKLEKRLKNLAAMLVYSQETQQWAIYENVANEILNITREQEAALFGISKIIKVADVEKFIPQVKDKVLKFKDLSEFPRVLPIDVRKKLKKLQDKQIFDSYSILYTDFTEPTKELKSNKQKIIEKDPILFGVFKNMPENLYFIADWEDEYCDLTLDKLVDKLTKLDKEYKVDTVPDLTPECVENLKQDLLNKHKRLEETKMDNFRELAKKEDEDRRALMNQPEPLQEVVEEFTADPFFSKLKKLFKIVF